MINSDHIIGIEKTIEKKGNQSSKRRNRFMVFKYFLSSVKAETEEDILKWSVKYGWGLVAIGLISFILLGIFEGLPSSIRPGLLINTVMFTWLASFVLFIMRYTTAKPILGAAAAGITTVAFAAIFDSLFGRRDGAFAVGALIGSLLVIGILLLKNIVVSWYYLLSETIRYIKYTRSQVELDPTVL